MNKHKVVGLGTVTNSCNGVVGSFGEFNSLLKKHGMACKRVKITYEEISEYEENVMKDMFGTAYAVPIETASTAVSEKK